MFCASGAAGFGCRARHLSGNPQITEFRGELRLWHTLAGGPAGPGVYQLGNYCASCTNGTTPWTCRNESETEPSTANAAAAPPVSAKLIVASDPAGPWRNLDIKCAGFDPEGGSGCPGDSAV